MNEKSCEVYAQSKTKKYFHQVKLIMENTLLGLSQKSFRNYSDYINSFMPSSVEVISPQHVINHYSDGSTQDSTIAGASHKTKCRPPLFETNIMKSYD